MAFCLCAWPLSTAPTLKVIPEICGRIPVSGPQQLTENQARNSDPLPGLAVLPSLPRGWDDNDPDLEEGQLGPWLWNLGNVCALKL